MNGYTSSQEKFLLELSREERLDVLCALTAESKDLRRLAEKVKTEATADFIERAERLDAVYARLSNLEAK